MRHAEIVLGHRDALDRLARRLPVHGAMPPIQRPKFCASASRSMTLSPKSGHQDSRSRKPSSQLLPIRTGRSSPTTTALNGRSRRASSSRAMGGRGFPVAQQRCSMTRPWSTRCPAGWTQPPQRSASQSRRTPRATNSCGRCRGHCQSANATSPMQSAGMTARKTAHGSPSIASEDVIIERMVFNALPPMPLAEQENWELDAHHQRARLLHRHRAR